jgi:hypothetical protein
MYPLLLKDGLAVPYFLCQVTFCWLARWIGEFGEAEQVSVRAQ